MSDKHINEEENEDMNKSGKVIAGVVVIAGASLAIVGGAYAYNKSNSIPKEAKIVTSSQVSSSSSRASSSSDKSSSAAEVIRSNSISAQNSLSAQASLSAEAVAKAEAERQAAEAAAKAQAEAEEAARKAAEEAERQVEADRQAAAARQQTEPVYEEPSYEPEPTPSGGSGNWTAEDEAARAEGFADAASKKSFQEYAEKYYPGQDVHLATDEELKDWGIVIDW